MRNSAAQQCECAVQTFVQRGQCRTQGRIDDHRIRPRCEIEQSAVDIDEERERCHFGPRRRRQDIGLGGGGEGGIHGGRDFARDARTTPRSLQFLRLRMYLC